jgi:hydroxymethylpyrimidine pyrophosphatase-like HAD family hydrolase
VQIYRQDARKELVADQEWLEQLEADWDQDEMQVIYERCTQQFAQWVVTPNANQSGNVEEYRFNVLVRVDHNAEAAEIVMDFIRQEVEKRNLRMVRNEKELKVHVCCCVAGKENERWVSFMPRGAGKGNALKHVLTTLQTSYRRVICDPVIVCGDSGNDISMMKVDGIDKLKAVVVNNGGENIKSFVRENVATENYLIAARDRARGVLEGLQYFAGGEQEGAEEENEETQEDKQEEKGWVRKRRNSF